MLKTDGFPKKEGLPVLNKTGTVTDKLGQVGYSGRSLTLFTKVFQIIKRKLQVKNSHREFSESKNMSMRNTDQEHSNVCF